MDGKRKLPEGVRPLRPDIRTMPEEEIASFLRGWFADAAAAEDPDAAMILGTKARTRPADLINPELPAWLHPESPVAAATNAAWFLAGFWTLESEIPDALAMRAASALTERLNVPEVRDALLLALGIAASAQITEAARSAIREAFSAVRRSTKAATLPDYARAALQALT